MKNTKKRKHHSHISIDYYAYLSRLKTWNASYKAIFAMGALLLVIIADSIRLSLLTVLFMGILSVAVGRIKCRDYIRLMLIPFTFIMLSGIAILLQIGNGANSLYSLHLIRWDVYITEESIWQFVHLSSKALGAVSCLYMLTLSTPMGEIISVLRSLCIPNLILELMHLIYRYIFILTQISTSQKWAAQSRLGYCDRRTFIRTFGSQMANLLILSMKKSESYYDALEARSGQSEMLFWEEKRSLSACQFVWGGAYLLMAITVIYFKV